MDNCNSGLWLLHKGKRSPHALLCTVASWSGSIQCTWCFGIRNKFSRNAHHHSLSVSLCLSLSLSLIHTHSHVYVFTYMHTHIHAHTHTHSCSDLYCECCGRVVDSPDVHVELSVYLKCTTLEHVRVSVKVRWREREREYLFLISLVIPVYSTFIILDGT